MSSRSGIAYWPGVSAVQEVFEAESECGCCHFTEIRFRVRTVEENDFYELICRNCAARFEFGQNKKGGGLFPKGRNESGMLPNRGWAKYEPLTSMNSSSDRRRPDSSRQAPAGLQLPPPTKAPRSGPDLRRIR